LQVPVLKPKLNVSVVESGTHYVVDQTSYQLVCWVVPLVLIWSWPGNSSQDSPSYCSQVYSWILSAIPFIVVVVVLWSSSKQLTKVEHWDSVGVIT